MTTTSSAGAFSRCASSPSSPLVRFRNENRREAVASIIQRRRQRRRGVLTTTRAAVRDDGQSLSPDEKTTSVTKSATERTTVRAFGICDDAKTPPSEEQQNRRSGMTTLEKEDEGDDDDDAIGTSFPELDYLQELIAIQKDCPKEIGFFGTRNMGFLHQQLIEILAYALCLTGNHIFTSGATGTNAAVIRGSLRAERPELLTVVLPQSLSKQPAESRELLEKVSQVEECPENDHLPLLEASRICNDVIVSKVRQVICFAFHDSTLLFDTCREAKVQRRMVTLFYLD